MCTRTTLPRVKYFFILLFKNFVILSFKSWIIGVATLVAATAVTAVITVGTNTSVGGIGIGGKAGKFSVGGGGGSAVFTGSVPSGSLRSLGGTTIGL